MQKVAQMLARDSVNKGFFVMNIALIITQFVRIRSCIYPMGYVIVYP